MPGRLSRGSGSSQAGAGYRATACVSHPVHPQDAKPIAQLQLPGTHRAQTLTPDTVGPPGGGAPHWPSGALPRHLSEVNTCHNKGEGGKPKLWNSGAHKPQLCLQDLTNMIPAASRFHGTTLGLGTNPTATYSSGAAGSLGLMS